VKWKEIGERLLLGWVFAAISLLFVGLFPHFELALYDIRIHNLRTLPERFYLLSESFGRYRGYSGLHRSITLLGDKDLPIQQSLQAHIQVLRALKRDQAAAVCWIVDQSPPIPSDLRYRPHDSTQVYVLPAQTGWNVKLGNQPPFVVRVNETDGVVRETYLALKDGEGTLTPCLPLVLYTRFLELEDCSPQTWSGGIEIGGRRIPADHDDNGYYLSLMTYPSERRAHTQLNELVTSVSDPLEPIRLIDALKMENLYFGPKVYGRFYFMGAFSMSAVGERSTPTGHFRDFQMAAMALDTLIQGPYIRWLTGPAFWVHVALTSGFLAFWLLSPASLWMRGFRLCVLFVAYYLVGLGLCAAGYYVPTAWGFLYVALLTAWTMGRKWILTVGYLRRYGGTAAARMAQLGHTNFDHDQAEERLATIVFVGLPGHLRQQELDDDPKLLEHRQIFSKQVAEITHRWGGIVHDFQADYLMLGFGTHPGTVDTEHAFKAFEAAKELISSREYFESAWNPVVEHGARVQVSVNSGQVAVGWVGTSKYKRASAAIGDTTNVAARLLGTAKKLDLDLIVSQSAYVFLQELGHFEPLPPVMLKGKTEAVAIYKLAGGP